MNWRDKIVSNQITYEYFCVLNGLSCKKVTKIIHQNGTYIYFTYHLSLQGVKNG